MRLADPVAMRFTALFVLIHVVTVSAVAQVPTEDTQLSAATLPLPDGMRTDAKVIGWSEEGERTELREGTNGMVCVADEPGDDRFRVVCYPESLHPLLSRRRELGEEGLEETERDRRLDEEVKAGRLDLPDQAAVLHVLDGPVGGFDPATGQVGDGIDRLQIIFTPYQTAETMGLPTERQGDMPWVMNSGELFSHIMIVRADEEEGE